MTQGPGIPVTRTWAGETARHWPARPPRGPRGGPGPAPPALFGLSTPNEVITAGWRYRSHPAGAGVRGRGGPNAGSLARTSPGCPLPVLGSMLPPRRASPHAPMANVPAFWDGRGGACCPWFGSFFGRTFGCRRHSGLLGMHDGGGHQASAASSSCRPCSRQR